MPIRGSQGAAGLDFSVSQEAIIAPYHRVRVMTRIRAEFPYEHSGLIVGRSGWAAAKGLLVFNGVIDRDFTGVMEVLAFNNSDRDIHLFQGDRIA